MDSKAACVNQYRPIEGELLSQYYARVGFDNFDHPDVQYFLTIWRDAMHYGAWGTRLPKAPKAQPPVVKDLKVRNVTNRYAFWFYRDQLDELLGPPENWAEVTMRRLAA